MQSDLASYQGQTKQGSRGTYMLFKFLIFSHVGYTSVKIKYY